MTVPLLGLAVAPNPRYLGLAKDVIEEFAELLEITPETLWAADCAPGPFVDLFAQVVRRSGLPVVGHGVGLSLGEPGLDDRARRWLAAIARDHAGLGFRWYSEHLGFVGDAGRQVALPLPLPFTEEAVQVVAARLRALAAVVPDVAFENNVAYAAPGDPRAEPAFLNAIAGAADCGILLDLHNVHVQCDNLGVDADTWLDDVDLARVVEIHVAGGSVSSPGWLASGRTFRLDTHDAAVPEEVWTSLARLLPRCPSLRAVVYERIDASLAPESVPDVERDLRRLRTLLDDAGRATSPPSQSLSPSRAALASSPSLDAWRSEFVDALLAGGRATDVAGHAVEPDGLRLTSLLVTKLRFQRVTGGDRALLARFERDPAAFTAVFRRYCDAVAPRFVFPEDEARAFHAYERDAG